VRGGFVGECEAAEFVDRSLKVVTAMLPAHAFAGAFAWWCNAPWGRSREQRSLLQWTKSSTGMARPRTSAMRDDR
jgi:hypothetical protein